MSKLLAAGRDVDLPLDEVRPDWVLLDALAGRVGNVGAIGAFFRFARDDLGVDGDLNCLVPDVDVHGADAVFRRPDERADLVHHPRLVPGRKNRPGVNRVLDALLLIVAAEDPASE